MTTPVPAPKLLKEYLDDLTEERLKEFQWYLVQIQTDGSRPIPKSKLEKATRVETVNKLVEAFGEDGAVEWTVDTFLRMKLNDLASKLVQGKISQNVKFLHIFMHKDMETNVKLYVIKCNTPKLQLSLMWEQKDNCSIYSRV